MIAVILFLVILVGLRNYLVIANTYGFSSPLTYNVSVVKYAVKDAFKLDLTSGSECASTPKIFSRCCLVLWKPWR